MRQIELTQGKVALVDDEDFEWLMKFNWGISKGSSGIFYAFCRIPVDAGIGRGMIMMHRFIMMPDEYTAIDHIDGNGLNNQKNNLRFATVRENAQNQHRIKSSRFPGVDWRESLGKWRASIRIGKKKVYLGLFDVEEEAFQAYKDVCDSLE